MVNVSVKDHMKLSPVFLYKNSSLYNAIEIMKSYNSDNVAIIDDDFTILGTITKSQIVKELDFKLDLRTLKNKSVSDIINNSNNHVVLYEGTPVLEAYSIMKCLNTRSLPVVDFPWEKKIKGYIWLSDIAAEIDKIKLKQLTC